MWGLGRDFKTAMAAGKTSDEDEEKKAAICS